MEEQGQPASSDEAVESGALDESTPDDELERSGDRGDTAESGAVDGEDASRQ